MTAVNIIDLTFGKIESTTLDTKLICDVVKYKLKTICFGG